MDNKIYSATIASILHVLDECSTQEVELVGLNDDSITQLSSLNLKGQKYIASRAAKFISVRIDSKALDNQIDQLKKYDEESEQENQFLLHGAPYHLMRELFGLHTAQFSLMRKRLGLYNQGRHRPAYCDEVTEHRLWYLWHEHLDLDIRTRYLKVAQLSGQPICVIYTAINRHTGNNNQALPKK